MRYNAIFISVNGTWRRYNNYHEIIIDLGISIDDSGKVFVGDKLQSVSYKLIRGANDPDKHNRFTKSEAAVDFASKELKKRYQMYKATEM